ncbi:hypothetical protein EON83_22915 [bacterium]|nr:MAG: hypothetical protein EON83_22915 [bacterium]
MTPISKKLFILSVFIPGLCVHVDAEPYRRDEVTLQEITKPLNTATMDDYLLDMAKATKINVIADATDFPQRSVVKPYPSTTAAITGLKGQYQDKWGPVLINMMSEFVAQQKLSMLRSDSRTFLFWSEPDPHQLFQLQRTITENMEAARFAQALAVAKEEGVPEAEVIKGELSDLQLQIVLSNYLKAAHGWTPTVVNRNSKVNLQMPLEKLPLDFQALILLELRNLFARSSTYRMLNADFWQTADVRVSAKKAGNVVTLELAYKDPTAPNERDSFPLAAIDQTVAAPAVETALTPPSPAKILAATTPQLDIQKDFLDTYNGISNKVSAPQLDGNAKLQTPVTLELKRVALRDLLVQLSQQTGVSLIVGENAPANKTITARVDKMPLSQFMGLLSRIYGVKWNRPNKTGAASTYEMQSSERGQLHLNLLQIGDSDQYRHRFNLLNRADRENERLAVGRDVIQQIGLEALQAPNGTAFADLPQVLQQRVRDVVETPQAESGAVFLYKIDQMIADQLAQKGLILRFGTPVDKAYCAPNLGLGATKLPDWLSFTVQSADGQVLLPAFMNFGFNMAKPGERDIRPPSRRR